MANRTATNEPQTFDEWIGLTAYGSEGEEIGQIGDIYLDEETNRPQWLTIKAGLFGMNRHFAPIEGAEYRSGYIRISSTKDQVKDAPSLDADNDHLEPDEESRLYSHYEIDRPSSATTKAAATPETAAPTAADTASVIRSEEQLNVDTTTKAAGAVTLRKYVVTEDVDLTVPVRREVAKVVREPADPNTANRGPISNEGSEETIVLREEEVVVDKEVVDKEVISVETDVETDREHVTDTIRKERVRVDGDINNPNR